MSGIPKDTKWSFSRLTTYRQCPQAFKLQYIDRVPQEGNFYSDYGTYAHELLE